MNRKWANHEKKDLLSPLSFPQVAGVAVVCSAVAVFFLWESNLIEVLTVVSYNMSAFPPTHQTLAIVQTTPEKVAQTFRQTERNTRRFFGLLPSSSGPL